MVSDIASERRMLSGWGRFPVEACQLYRPEKRSDLLSILASGGQSSYLARGLGRSYGDAPLNFRAGVISHERLNRFLEFDPSTGELECEAGVSIAEMVDVLLPRGFFPAVTPGTKYVTAGGAIAADVHGKNHHRDGSLANFVRSLRLLTSDGQVLDCSPAQNAEAFWATLGGMGLTGVILSARIVLRRVESAYLTVSQQRTLNLDESLDLMTEWDSHFEYSVAWIDCLASAGSLGRSVLIRGDHAAADRVGRRGGNPLLVSPRLRLNVPFDLPSFALNRWTVGAFNAIHYGLHRGAREQLMDYERFFYPLDGIRNWNRLYGRRGFVQYQVALPVEASRPGMIALLKRIAGSGRASFLAVLKRFGPRNRGLLSFPIPGCTLALDLPVSRDLVPFLQELDAVVLDYGGRVYLAKDAVLRPEAFGAMYPQLDDFRDAQRKLDPRRIFSSSMARRLGILEPCLSHPGTRVAC